MGRRAYIVGTGHSVPDNVLTNQDLEKMVDTSDEWITTRTGIKERRIAPEGTASSDYAIEAAKRAMEAAGWSSSDVDALLIATITPDTPFPSTGCRVSNSLGMNKIPAFDLSAGCSGFIYGLIQAKGLILSEICERVLVIGVEMLSRITDWEDRNTCVLFGDGAGAAAVSSKGPGGELGGWHWGSDGSLGELLQMPAGGSRMPACEESVKNRLHTVKMEGREIFRYAVRAMRDSCLLALEKDGTEKKDVDLLISHQANTRIIDATARALELKPEQVFINIHKYGNTSAASIPIALDEALRSGVLEPPKNVVLAAFGAGLTWAGLLVKWREEGADE